MHYYKFNIADYRKDTMHLSALEHGVYRQLIDEYYLHEKPVKTDLVIRRLRLHTEEEKNALHNVLHDFFAHDAQTDSWTLARAEQEIEAYCTRVNTARSNGNKGGRPKKHKETKSVNCANQSETKTKTNHKPITINQELIINKCFPVFWEAGMCKKNKKRAESIFTSLAAKQKDPEQFAQTLAKDIQARLERNQLGFDQMHPTTYLNGERWNDDLPSSSKPNGKHSGFDLANQQYETGVI